VLVQRPRLLSRLEGSSLPLVLVMAPSGYGKSVLIGQWSERDPRPYPTLILGDEHNDPAMLIGSIVTALDVIEPVAPEVVTALANPRPSIKKVVLTRLGDSLERRQVPFVLVLDDFERIVSAPALDVVKTLISHLPRGSQLVLASRTEPELAIGRLRVQGAINELGAAELVMTKGECQEMLGALGLELEPRQLDTLVARTEGWPAALHLAGLALRDAPELDEAIIHFAGDDRFVVDYIREEFLESASRRQLDFLRRASILDRLSGDLCDSVLERRGSATQLRELSRTNMLLTPLDRRDEWFRFHPLFREMLRAELRRSGPEEEAGLDRRASDWWAAQGDWDRAIRHAVAAGALDRAGELLWMGIPEFTTRGRNATVVSWLDRLGEGAVATDAALSLTASYAQITQGAGGKTEYWAAVAAALIEREPPSDKKAVLTAGLGLIEAALARGGVEGITDQTALAAELLPGDSPWMSMCRLLEGVGLHLQGRRAEAHEKLVDGARRGAISAPNVQVLCLSQLALLAIEADDWTLAEVLASQARAQLDRSGIDEYPMMALALSVSAVVRSRTGRLEAAAADLRQGRALLERLEDFAPWYEAETWVVLARASIRLGDAPGATLMLAEASRVLKLTPDATVLGEWIAETALSIELVAASAIRDLTPAELHILQYLPTHLSFPQIAGQVFVSPNTVKSQAQSVYRKLGVTSRREAVEQARAAGLLNPDGPESDTVKR
jgi:LuxR family transcriptional regulator, maltose regulon positive regulatory protein